MKQYVCDRKTENLNIGTVLISSGLGGRMLLYFMLICTQLLCIRYVYKSLHSLIIASLPASPRDYFKHSMYVFKSLRSMLPCYRCLYSRITCQINTLSQKNTLLAILDFTSQWFWWVLKLFRSRGVLLSAPYNMHWFRYTQPVNNSMFNCSN